MEDSEMDPLTRQEPTVVSADPGRSEAADAVNVNQQLSIEEELIEGELIRQTLLSSTFDSVEFNDERIKTFLSNSEIKGKKGSSGAKTRNSSAAARALIFSSPDRLGGT